MTPSTDDRLARERAAWDEAHLDLAQAIAELETEPDPNTRLMLDSIAPRPGLRVLDFACGVGITACRLAQAGAVVTAIDLSPVAIETGRRLADHAGVAVTFLTGDAAALDIDEPFDAMVGRYALHHFDVVALAPRVAGYIRPGGRAAFLETMGLSAPLRLARLHLVGRLGVPRFGTLDEKPLEQPELDALRAAFGSLRLDQGRYVFLAILDRQVFAFRYPRLSRLACAGDRILARLRPTARWSYHQVITLTRT